MSAGYATIKTDANVRIWLTWNKSYIEVSLADLDTNEISLEGKTIIIGVKVRIRRCGRFDRRTIRLYSYG